MVNIDKDDKKTWWKIYEAIDEPYFVKVKSFFNTVKNKNNHKIFHPEKKVALEEGLYSQVFMIRRKNTAKRGQNIPKSKTITCFKDIHKDSSIGLILI